MKAQTGDQPIMKGTHVGDHQRVGVVIEVRGENGTPPYLVRWLDNGHEALCFPGADARIETAERS